MSTLSAPRVVLVRACMLHAASDRSAGPPWLLADYKHVPRVRSTFEDLYNLYRHHFYSPWQELVTTGRADRSIDLARLRRPGSIGSYIYRSRLIWYGMI